MAYISGKMKRGPVAALGKYIYDLEKLKDLLRALKYGDKLLCPPILFNVPKGENIFSIIEQSERDIPRNANSWFSLIVSLAAEEIQSPEQFKRTLKFLFKVMTPLAYIVVDNKKVPYDLNKLRGTVAIHCNTDNTHGHGLFSILDSETGRIVHLNDDFWKLALAYARQQLLILKGEKVPGFYLLAKQKDGLCKIVVDKDLIKKLADELTADQKIELLEVSPGLIKKFKLIKAELTPEQWAKIERLTPKLEKTKAEVHRGQPNSARLFLHLAKLHYPDGPPPEAPKPIPEAHVDGVGLTTSPSDPVFQKLKKAFVKCDEERAQRHNVITQAREQLEKLLKDNNMSISTGKNGGLVLHAGGEPSAMSQVPKRWRWTREALEKAFDIGRNKDIGLKGGMWSLGTPLPQQSVEHSNIISYQTWLSKGNPAPAKTKSKHHLQWKEAHVEIRRLNGTNLRMEATIDVDLQTQYERGVMDDGKLAMVSMRLRPIMPPGQLLICIEEIPAKLVDVFVAKYQPALLLKLGENNYTGVLVIGYEAAMQWDPVERPKIMNSRSATGNSICHEVGAKSWSDGFLAPNVAQLINGKYLCPAIYAAPHRNISVVAQQMLQPAWRRLHEAEIKWALKMNENEQKMLPGKSIFNYQLAPFEPLRLGAADNSMEGPQDAERVMTPVVEPTRGQPPTDQDKEKVDEKQQTRPPTTTAPDLIDQEKEKRKKERQRKLNILLICDLSAAYGQGPSQQISETDYQIGKAVWAESETTEERKTEMAAFRFRSAPEPAWLDEVWRTVTRDLAQEIAVLHTKDAALVR